MTKVMTSNDGEHQIRGNPGTSSYFQGGYRTYGKYAWNVKYYGWEDYESEIEEARSFFFGEYVQDPKTRKAGCTLVPAIIGRTPHEDGGALVDSGFDGRSGGWFVVNEELEEEELQKLDQYIKEMMDGDLKQFLSEERAGRAQQQREEEDTARERRRQILGDLRLHRLVAQLQEIAGDDFSLVVHGLDVVQTLEETLTDPEKAL